MVESVLEREKVKLSWKKKLLFAGILLFFPFIFLEIFLRLLGFETLPPELSMEKAENLLGKPLHPGVCYSMPVGVQGIHAGVAFKTNNLGMRDRVRDEKKPAGVKRVLVLGDSMVFGQAVEQEKVFTHLLEQKLGSSIEVLNAGHCAYNTEEEYHFLKYRGLKWEPDILILGYCLVNDTIDCTQAENDFQIIQERQNKIQYQLSTFLERHSVVFHLGSAWIRFYALDGARTAYIQKLYEGEPWKKSQQYLLRIYELCRARQIPFHLMIFPVTYTYEAKNDFLKYRFQELHEKVQQTFQEKADVFWIDLLPSLQNYQKQYPQSSLVVPYDGHPNEKFHQLIAEVLYSTLKSQLFVD